MVAGRSVRTAPAARPKAPARSAEQWAVFVWRLPMGSSTPRVTVWRVLRPLGAAALTPGAPLLPWREAPGQPLASLAPASGATGGDAWGVRGRRAAERRR